MIQVVTADETKQSRHFQENSHSRCSFLAMQFSHAVELLIAGFRSKVMFFLFQSGRIYQDAGRVP